jgi:hypothetical protein
MLDYIIITQYKLCFFTINHFLVTIANAINDFLKNCIHYTHNYGGHIELIT